jgi:acyl-CoA thioesterase FadM
MTEGADPNHTRVTLRCRYEGANIRSWVGFKQIMYLFEDAVLAWFRERQCGPQRVYHETGFGLEVTDVSALLVALLEIDDEVQADITAKRPGRFEARLSVKRQGALVVAAKAKLSVAMIREKGTHAGKPIPDHLKPLAFDQMAAATSALARPDLAMAAGGEVSSVLAPPGSRAFLWSWRARYFHCHYSDRVQYGSYIGALEEVVDRFLADRGISIGRLLDERGWIPVVSRVRLQMLMDVHMEETVHTTFAVEEVLKGTVFDARMNCYVQRGERLVQTAAGHILHGYAASEGEAAGRLVEMDDRILSALTAENPA